MNFKVLVHSKRILLSCSSYSKVRRVKVKIILVAKISRLEYEKKYGSVVGKEVERSGGELIKVGANFFYVRRRTRKG